MIKQAQALFLVLTDGKPGHQTQSDGVVKLLKAHHLDSECIYINIKKVPKILNVSLRFLSNHFDLSGFLEKYLTLPHLKSAEVIYVISAGGDTLVPNVLLKRQLLKKGLHVNNIVLSSLRGVRPDSFNAVFTINSQFKQKPYFFYYPIAPNKMVFKANDFKKQDTEKETILILIGADTKEVKIGSVQSWFDLIEKLKKQYPTTQVILTTSRRTSIGFEQGLLERLMQSELTKHEQYYMYNLGNQISIDDLILKSKFVVISQDSGSMVSEAIMAEKKVLLVGNSNELQNRIMQNYFETLVEHNFLAYIDFNENDFKDKLKSLNIQNHSSILSEKLQIMISNQ